MNECFDPHVGFWRHCFCMLMTTHAQWLMLAVSAQNWIYLITTSLLSTSNFGVWSQLDSSLLPNDKDFVSCQSGNNNVCVACLTFSLLAGLAIVLVLMTPTTRSEQAQAQSFVTGTAKSRCRHAVANPSALGRQKERSPQIPMMRSPLKHS